MKPANTRSQVRACSLCVRARVRVCVCVTRVNVSLNSVHAENLSLAYRSPLAKLYAYAYPRKELYADLQRIELRTAYFDT